MLKVLIFFCKVSPISTCTFKRPSLRNYKSAKSIKNKQKFVPGDTADTESCLYNYGSMAPVATISGYNNLPPNDQEAIMQHIAEVPCVS